VTAGPQIRKAAGAGVAEQASGTAPSSWQVLRGLAGSRAQVAVFAVLAVGVALLYTLLLPFEFTQRLSFANWGFLTGPLAAWSVALGVGIAFVLTVQFSAVRQLAAARSTTLTGVALVASLLPSFLCCTPIIPTVLAFGGLSAASVYGTTGTLQYFFAVHQTAFLAGSLALLAVTGWWAVRRVARAQCLTGACAVPSEPGGRR
jgi:hypothetical protein